MRYDSPMVFVDLETTGASANSSRVLEVGLHRVEKLKLVKSYQTLVDPEEFIPSFITQLTGIQDEHVAWSPTFKEISRELKELLSGAIFVAHNVGFDYSFLQKEFKNCGISFSPQKLCTVKLSRSLYPQFRRHNLDSLIARHGFSIDSRHRASDDALVLWKFYQKILRTFDIGTINATLSSISQ